MPTMKTSGDLIASISADLADNNAGLISAFDVRHNMEDVAFSINKIVASGDTDTEFPFFNIIRASKSDAADATSIAATGGDVVVESGIFFKNAYTVANSLDNKRQKEPWLGVGEIDHGQLKAASLEDDDHHQYLHRQGVSLAGRGNAMQGNFAMDQFWFNTSGINNVGFQFVQTTPDAVEQEINVSGQLNFLRDNSFIPNTAKGVAKAWVNFDGSGTFDGVDNLPVVRSYYGISGIQRDHPGKFTITFLPGTFENDEYTAVGTANARTSAASQEDFEINTVGIVSRTSTHGGSTRTCTIAVLNQAGLYSDSDRIDAVFYGYSPGESSGVVPTMSLSATYTEANPGP